MEKLLKNFLWSNFFAFFRLSYGIDGNNKRKTPTRISSSSSSSSSCNYQKPSQNSKVRNRSVRKMKADETKNSENSEKIHLEFTVRPMERLFLVLLLRFFFKKSFCMLCIIFFNWINLQKKPQKERRRSYSNFNSSEKASTTKACVSFKLRHVSKGKKSRISTARKSGFIWSHNLCFPNNFLFCFSHCDK